MLISWIYPFSFSVLFFLTLRFLPGFSAGFTPTGSTALLTDIIPAEKRGQAMGIWGTFISLGFGVGQFSGSWIGNHFGMDALFFIAGLTSVLSGLFLFRVEETLEHPERFDGSQLKVKWIDVVEPSVIPAAIVMVLTASCSGIIFVLTPDMSGFVGIENKRVLLWVLRCLNHICTAFYVFTFRSDRSKRDHAYWGLHSIHFDASTCKSRFLQFIRHFRHCIRSCNWGFKPHSICLDC